MTVQNLPKPTLAIGAPRGLQPTDMESAWRMATAIAKSGFAPKAYGQGEQGTAAVFVAMQLGAEVGLSPMASIQNIAVINGKPGLYGPAMLALVEASGKLESHDETLEGQGDTRVAVVTTKRQGRQPRTQRYGVPDAKRAGLWGKSGPWSQYPDRMLLMRARTFLLRDVYPDVLLGLCYGAEELHDMGPEFARDVTPADDRRSGAAAVAEALAGPVDEPQEPYETEPAGDAVSPRASETAAELGAASPAHAEPAAVELPIPEVAEMTVPMMPNGKTPNWPAYSGALQEAALAAPSLEWIEAFRKANRAGLNGLFKGNQDEYKTLLNVINTRKSELTTGGLTP